MREQKHSASVVMFFSNITVGDFYEFIAQIKASNWDGWDYIQLRMNRNGSNPLIYSYDLRQESSGFPWPADAMTDFHMLRTENVVTTNDTTGFTPYIEFGIKGDAVDRGN